MKSQAYCLLFTAYCLLSTASAQIFEFDTGIYLHSKGISEFGLPPHYYSHSREEITYENDLTGRAFKTAFPDSFVAEKAPISELFYEKGAFGLQSAGFLHAQKRKNSRFDFGLRGEKITGWLSNQAIKNQQGQLNYQRGNWSVYTLYSYQKYGANGGDEIPFSTRERQFKRNDVKIKYAKNGFSIKAYHHIQESKVLQSDTLWANTQRAGISVVQKIKENRFSLNGWADIYHKGNLDIAKNSLYPQASLQWYRTWQIGQGNLASNLVLDYADGGLSPSFDVAFAYKNISLEGGIQPAPDAWILRNGFTKLNSTSYATANGEGLNPIRGKISYQKNTKKGQLSAHIFGMHCARCDDFFETATSDLIEYKSIKKQILGSELQWIFNPKETVGFNSSLTLLNYFKRDQTLPQVSGNLTLGYKFKAFKNDLSTHIFVKSTYKSPHFARSLHTSTGLWAIPYQPTQSQKGFKLDAGIELGIRENAHIHLMVENLLNQEIQWIPNYTLPETWLRGAVVWKLKD